MTSDLSKNRENSMQMSYGLYMRILVDMAYLKEPVVNAVQVVPIMNCAHLVNLYGMLSY